MQGQPSQGQISASGIPTGCYLVADAVPRLTVSGNSRTNVQIRDSVGQVSQVYTRGVDSRLAPGLILANVNSPTQRSSDVALYILEAHRIPDPGSEQAA